MEKKVLVLYYTQTGQLTDIVNSFCQPIVDAGVSVEKILLTPLNDFTFPWTSDSFFDAMPESGLCIPVELKPFQLKEKSYDLIIFGYQPWFLSPSIPASSILLHPVIKNIMHDTPVITLIGARNMWLSAQEKVKKMLKESEAKLVGNVALIDHHNNHLSAVSILHWMLEGKKERKWGIFPKPGVSEHDILHSGAYGETVLHFLNKNNWEGMQEKLIEQKALEVIPNLMFIETRGAKVFSIWANLIYKKKNRRPWLIAFKYYLLIALFIVAPFVVLINELLFKPFLRKQINKKKQYYLGLN
ncbi:MAG: hypothetical protein H7259_08070 [Cytophagales bacterium]|nr:hypothetical protein [Cytophaga sp.]